MTLIVSPFLRHGFRTMSGAVLLAALVLAPVAHAQTGKAKLGADKAPAASQTPAGKTSPPGPESHTNAPATGKLPALLKSSPTRKANGNKASKPAAASEPALDPKPTPAFEKTSPDAASARRRAMVALNTGHYEDAIKAIEEAYALDQDPVLLFRLAQAYRLAGQPTKALDACEAYLRSAEKDAAERAEVEHFLAEVEMIAFQIRLQREYGMSPQPPPPQAPAPRSPPRALQPPPLALDVTQPPPLPAPESATPDLTKAPALPAIEPTPPFYKRTLFWVAVGGVVAAGTAAAIWYAATSHGAREPKTALGYQGAFQ